MTKPDHLNRHDKEDRDALLSLINAEFEITRGSPYPFGSTLLRGGINFAVFSTKATAVSLVIFGACNREILMEFPLDPRYNRTGNVWHAFVKGLDAGISYGYRVTNDDIRGKYKHDNRIILLDPYAQATCGGNIWGKPLQISRDDREHTLRLSLIIDNKYDWEFDQPLNIPLRDTIIYELHVRGFTNHPSSEIANPGTFTGLTQKIPYLKSLGITAVELMPVTDFDETSVINRDPRTGEKLFNFWGYDPISFFAPKASYAVHNEMGQQVNDFKSMVKAFHEAGLEVILDMVFNHTGEGNHDGPVYNLKGLDNSTYYLIDAASNTYQNYSGCGNTINCNHPVLRNMIMDSLRYWVMEMHVDGFRFDLASILGRGRDGEVLSNPPLLEQIAEDPILANTKLSAEAWDAAGLYQVGDFPHWKRWMEWNGKFRDDIRRFINGDPGMSGRLATRLSGSSDLYQDDGREPFHSVNFVTCHDGFSLYDLVSYNEKHNWANGENNRDGGDFNSSWNCGMEGETNLAEIKRLRVRQQRNYAAVLLLAQGVPMILAGDEFGRTQKGNNNAYCQDNEISWIDWSLAESNKNLLRFFKLLINFRKQHPNLRRSSFVVGMNDGRPEMSWHGFQLNQPDWSENSRSLAVHYQENKKNNDCDIFIIFNADDKSLSFELPPLSRIKSWYRVMDTYLESPLDFCDEGQEIKLGVQSHYHIWAYSAVLLIAR
jgi:glycogen operon protein